MAETLHGIRTDLTGVSAAEAMTAGVVACPLETPLADVARLMADRRIHCVVARDADEPTDALWGVVADLDLVAAASAGDLERQTAEGIAATPAVTVASDETLQRAAQLLTEHAVTHLIVVDPGSGTPVGVLSTLDVARAVAAVVIDDEPSGRRP